MGAPPPIEELPACDKYRSMPDTFGHCVYKMAGGCPDAATVAELCPLA